VNDELTEKVAREMANEIGDDGDNWLIYSPEARAAIRVVVEECAKCCDGDFDSEMRSYGRYFASEIRKLAQEDKP
jgi:hypothetical protein